MEKVGKATHDLVLVTTDIENELTPWENQIKEGRKKVEPNMTGNFVIVYKLDPANGAKTNATHYIFEPYDSKFGKSLTVKAYESKPLKNLAIMQAAIHILTKVQTQIQVPILMLIQMTN